MLTGSEIREKFLRFFEEKGHRRVHSSSLVPANDPTLLFTNAGMNQFKDVFLGLEKRDYTRATSSQKCVRAGGKHNDLENVGFTNRHHTFFEMLGNFSFGDYFKKDAIAYAWELITSPDWYGIDKGKLYVTIFNGEGGMQRDAEAHDLWLAQGAAKDRIFEAGLKDNFWQMGDTGPCGPCSEIHYDMGAAASDSGHADCAFPCDCGRYVEIWNLVFMQFNRIGEGEQFLDLETMQPKYPSYRLDPLPKPSIDTGMGLERVTAVLQGVISNYGTDLFEPLREKAKQLVGLRKLSGVTEDFREFHTKSAASLNVIADHSRAVSFLISDGVMPSNEGRGYVLRKIVRRAITHGRLLGQTKPFLHEMVFAVRDAMSNAYPELTETANRVSRIVLAEETKFARTLRDGLEHLEQNLRDVALQALRKTGATSSVLQDAETQDLAHVMDQVERWGGSAVYPGGQAFTLYDTFGLPRDFIQDACRDLRIVFDQAGFDGAMAEQRARARASWKGAAKQTANPVYQHLAERLSAHSTIASSSGIPMIMPQSKFVGYTQTEFKAEVLAILKAGIEVQQLGPGEQGEVILDWTPFYAESGGQVGDRGWFYSDDHNTVVAEVTGCYYPIQGVRAHQVVLKPPPYENRVGWATRIQDRGQGGRCCGYRHSHGDDAQPHGDTSFAGRAAGSFG